MKKRGGLVYSTDGGRHCSGCRRPVESCVCRDRSRPREGDGVVTVSRETKARKGAGVTLIRGLPLADVELVKLAKALKSRCGVGGTVKDGMIELQGDQREKAQAYLAGEGYRVKRSGG
ncbi:MAG: translation initiation factor Sui1 [Pseudomonadales bacterium]